MLNVMLTATMRGQSWTKGGPRPGGTRAERTNNEKEHFHIHSFRGRNGSYLLAVRLENEGDSMDAAVLGGACG